MEKVRRGNILYCVRPKSWLQGGGLELKPNCQHLIFGKTAADSAEVNFACVDTDIEHHSCSVYQKLVYGVSAEEC